MDANFSYDLVTIVNALAGVGQLAGGFLADRYGMLSLPYVAVPSGIKISKPFSEPLNVLICSTLLAAVVNFAWPFATNVATLTVVAVFIGCVLIYPMRS